MKKILISVLIFIAIILTINMVNGETVELKRDDFSNKRVYCVEISQDFEPGSYNKKSITYSTDSTLAEFQSGLGHILSYNWTGTRLSETYGGVTYYQSGNDPVQLALWAYLNDYKKEAKEFFGDNNLNLGITTSAGVQRLYINHTAKTIKRSDVWVGTESNVVEMPASTTAYTLYKKAIEKRSDKDKYKFDIEYYYKSMNQTAMKVNTAEKDDDVVVNLTFKKQNFSGNPLALATITLSKGDNVSSISSTTLTSAGDGKFGGTIKVTPTKNTGTFEIKVTEEAPDGYISMGETTLTVTYDTTNGDVKSVTSTKAEVPEIKTTDTDKTIVIKNRPAVKLDFIKQNFNGNKLKGAKIEVTGYTSVSSITGINIDNTLRDSNNDGQFNQIIVYPSDNPTGETGSFQIKVKEKTAPTDYNKISSGEEVILTVEYYKNTGKVKSISTDKASEHFACAGNTTVITVKDDSKIVRDDPGYTIVKTDTMGNKVKDAEFSLQFTNIEYVVINGTKRTTSTVTGLKTDNNGEIVIDKIVAADDATKVSMTITETNPAPGYSGVTDTLTLTWNYNTDNHAWELETPTTPDYWEVNKSAATITVENKHSFNLIINKTDSLTNLPLRGARFKIELTNAESIKGYQTPQTGVGETQAPPSIVYVTTNAEGQIQLTGIVPIINADGTLKPITAKITEVEVPTAEGYYYKLLEEPIIVTITYNNSTKKWEATEGTVSGNTVTLGIENQPYIRLDGMVWEDGQTGEKDIAGPNGLKDASEQGIEGVIVELYSVKDGNVIRTATTNSTGSYSFEDIERTNEGYKVEFKYNGITHKETPYGTVSKASEVDRTGFNNRFKTIEKGKSNDGTALTYTYNISEKTSTLNSTIAGHTTGTTNGAFQISAQTGAYIYSESEVDCGLVKKQFDLSIGTDVKEATLKINEKETKYTYAQIMDGELTRDFQDNSSTAEDVTYNLYLYSSDYNYRIDDYITDLETQRKVNSERPESGYTETEGDANTDRIKELEAYVTYTVVLKSQTTKATTETSTVEEFVYYYDEAYTPHNIVSTSAYDVSIDEANRKITFTSKNNGFRISEPDYRVEVDLTFKINKDASGNLVVNETATNIAEITKYSTSEGGLIDKDSAPGNGITSGTITQYEDDTDEAKGLNIVLRTDETRTITGTVFDDTDKDGTNDENIPVDDVIVQLIEIKKIGGQYYEYIWQETRSGSNQVKTTARNGYPAGYTNSVTENGKYEFKDFIPGNYIIRFIYGDGKTYTLTENVQTYNGYDYKSTIDKNYTKAWYMAKNYDSTGVDSVARDNEARRLEVMAYSTTIDWAKGEKLANKTEEALENTWMCAETSRINIPVDDQAETEETEATNSTTASYDYTKNNTKVLFGNMNFGLALRPNTNLVLEKHITGLKIQPNGTGAPTIVEATADIEQILYNDNIETSGVTEGLATIKSERTERGFWKVEMDIEELAQGAELEVEYTYVIRNDGEEDYLSETLIQAYENKDIEPYEEVLGEIKETVKGTMRSGTYSYSSNPVIGTYLGQFYYTGEKAESDAKVSSRVEGLEEALNNQLKYDSTVAGGDFVKGNTEVIQKNVYDTDGFLKTENIETVVTAVNKTGFMITGDKDFSRTLRLTTVLSSVTGDAGYYPSYIAEITQYSNAAGRRNINATPANLIYVHSEDTSRTMATDNEVDEFWGEQIIISKPTGENKELVMQIAIITISSVAVLGVGIVLIKKFVLKK